MAIFNSYVKLPEGIYHYSPDISSPDISPDIFTIGMSKISHLCTITFQIVMFIPDDDQYIVGEIPLLIAIDFQYIPRYIHYGDG